jgi:hypothetical protein
MTTNDYDPRLINRKVNLLSQQTGKYGKSKIRSKQTKARKNTKKN